MAEFLVRGQRAGHTRHSCPLTRRLPSPSSGHRGPPSALAARVPSAALTYQLPLCPERVAERGSREAEGSEAAGAQL